jgi:cytochrome c
MVKLSCQNFDRNIFNMKKVSYRTQISNILGIQFVVLLLFTNFILAQDPATSEPDAAQSTSEVAVAGGDVVKGKQLFNQNCAACHFS